MQNVLLLLHDVFLLIPITFLLHEHEPSVLAVLVVCYLVLILLYRRSSPKIIGTVVSFITVTTSASAWVKYANGVFGNKEIITGSISAFVLLLLAAKSTQTMKNEASVDSQLYVRLGATAVVTLLSKLSGLDSTIWFSGIVSIFLYLMALAASNNARWPQFSLTAITYMAIAILISGIDIVRQFFAILWLIPAKLIEVTGLLMAFLLGPLFKSWRGLLNRGIEQYVADQPQPGPPPEVPAEASPGSIWVQTLFVILIVALMLFFIIRKIQGLNRSTASLGSTEIERERIPFRGIDSTITAKPAIKYGDSLPENNTELCNMFVSFLRAKNLDPTSITAVDDIVKILPLHHKDEISILYHKARYSTREVTAEEVSIMKNILTQQ